MLLGFSNGNFHKIFSNSNDRFSQKYINYYKAKGKARTIELNCLHEKHLDYLLDNDCDLSYFDFISLHTPDLGYKKNQESNRVLSKLKNIHKKYSIKNFIFHPDKIIDWDVFINYDKLPLSIENMDEEKKFGASIKDINLILEKYNFDLTLDLQHCFVNDNSMNSALELQKKYEDKIVEYHISGFHKKLLHYPLFKTKQNKIIKALKYKHLPIIIESGFEQLGELEKELLYIKNKIKN